MQFARSNRVCHPYLCTAQVTIIACYAAQSGTLSGLMVRPTNLQTIISLSATHGCSLRISFESPVRLEPRGTYGLAESYTFCSQVIASILDICHFTISRTQLLGNESIPYMGTLVSHPTEQYKQRCSDQEPKSSDLSALAPLVQPVSQISKDLRFRSTLSRTFTLAKS